MRQLGMGSSIVLSYAVYHYSGTLIVVADVSPTIVMVKYHTTPSNNTTSNTTSSSTITIIG